MTLPPDMNRLLFGISLARTFETGRESKIAIHALNGHSIGAGLLFILAEEGHGFTMQNAFLKVTLNSFLLSFV